MEDFAKKLCCSETMALSLRQCEAYRRRIGAEPADYPAAKDRREGKRILRMIEKETRMLPLPLPEREKGEAPVFRRIVMEEGALQNPHTERILRHFPTLPVSSISHYKDVFRRERGEHHSGRTLILAEKKGTLLYPGAPVCQDFGNRHFYYASNVMNCIFDCEYCYLKGMYPSSDMVVFLNTEDYFRETGELLKKHPVYLCISYDTDLPAIEEWTGLVREWSAFAAGKKDLLLEIRTKSAGMRMFEEIPPEENVIFAFTLSPDRVAAAFEHFAPPFSQRLKAIRFAMDRGFPVRLCFDPMLYCEDWRTLYGEMIDETAEQIDFTRVRDVSIGTFRISSEYLRVMRKRNEGSAVVQYPYTNIDAVYGYEKELAEEMTEELMSKIHKYIDRKRIFLWK